MMAEVLGDEGLHVQRGLENGHVLALGKVGGGVRGRPFVQAV